MNHLFATVWLSAAAFISTNIDDMCLLILLFSQIREKKQIYFIVAGEYLGIATLCVLSLLIQRGTAVLLGRYMWLIGIVPLCFGIKAIVDLIHSREEPVSSITAEGTWMLIFTEWSITVTNGGDNLSVYTPLLHDLGGGFPVFFSVMMIMTTVWWIAALCLHKSRSVSVILAKAGKYILPAVFLVIGMTTIFKGLVP